MAYGNRVFVVTGGGSGIGEAVVRLLASRGASVVIADINDDARRVEHEVERAGGAAAFVQVDVGNEGDVDAMVEFALSTYGHLDGAVNNAGHGHPVSRLHEIKAGDWDRVHATDLRGVWLCMRAEIRVFLASGSGVIVNTASAAGMKATPGQGAYVAAKHGVVGLTRQAAIEYVKDNIRVNAVAPGLVATPQVMSYPEKERDMWAALQPGGRLAEPEEIAVAIAWLLSDEASFVSGDVLVVDQAGMQG
jgi:NAD(P)-dependent dehydrogenase (short-subunit alcohol dehydrogenase family)